MPKPKKKGAVATASSTAVSEINIADFLESNAGDGMQNVSTDDLKYQDLKLNKESMVMHQKKQKTVQFTMTQH